MPTLSPSTPTLVTPTFDAPVDAAFAAFAWTPVPEALRYHLQIAADDAFAQDLVAVDAGPATELTLSSVLPARERTLWWRVRGETAAGAAAWSPAQPFVPASALALDAFSAQQAADAVMARNEAERERIAAAEALAQIPWYQREDHVSPRPGLIALATMAAAFVVMLLVVVAVAP